MVVKEVVMGLIYTFGIIQLCSHGVYAASTPVAGVVEAMRVIRLKHCYEVILSSSP